MGTQTITRKQDGSTDKSAISEDKDQAAAAFVEPAVANGYDFLTDITYYALFGAERSALASNAPTELLKTKDWGEWIEPFSEGSWAAPTAASDFEIDYTVKVAVEGDHKDSLDVNVRGRLRDDWKYELEFSSPKADENDKNQFSLYMVLAADVSEVPATHEELDASTDPGEDDSMVNTQTVTQDKTTTVAWRVERMVPGRGIADA